MTRREDPCPCGTGREYAACCGLLHDGEQAATAEELMRARYSAFVRGRDAYLFRSWHPRTRPDDVSPPGGLRWTGLRVLRTVDGGTGDESGVVEFAASYETASGPGVLHETSRFERRRGVWVYVDGVVTDGS